MRLLAEIHKCPREPKGQWLRISHFHFFLSFCSVKIFLIFFFELYLSNVYLNSVSPKEYPFFFYTYTHSRTILDFAQGPFMEYMSWGLVIPIPFHSWFLSLLPLMSSLFSSTPGLAHDWYEKWGLEFLYKEKEMPKERNLIKLEKRRKNPFDHLYMCLYLYSYVCGCQRNNTHDIYVLYMHVCISVILLEHKNFTAKIIFYAQSGYLFAFVFIIISVIGSTSKCRNSWLTPTTCLVQIYREGNNTHLIYSSYFLTNRIITILEWYPT